jgi:hypothetical protein
MLPSLIVIDGFYNNALEVRRYALSLPFDVAGNYPGKRTAPQIAEGTKSVLEKTLGAKIDYWPTDKYNGSFQLATGAERSWIHYDETTWAGVLYLTPDAPVLSGTAFYRHRETGLMACPGGSANPSAPTINRDAQKPEAWEEVDRVGNVFNRLVLFKGSRLHCSCPYFGDNPENARLFQLFFFNAEETTQ